MDEKRITLEGKTVVLHKAPATVAYDVALRYRDCLAKGDYQNTQECMYVLLRYCELELGDGRTIKLNDKEIINQHFHDAKTLVELQKQTAELNFGFFEHAAPSDSLKE